LLRILTNIEGFQRGVWLDTKGNIVTIDDQAFTETEISIPLVMFTMASKLGTWLDNAQPVRVTIGRKNNQTTVMKYDHLFLMVVLRGKTTADEFFSEARTILERKLSKI